MLKDTLAEFRAEAKAAGIPWSWVCQQKAELVENELEKRDEPNAIRRSAWEMHVGPDSGSAPFWRHGFIARFGARIAKGADFTCIPGYDTIAQQIASEFPRFDEGHAGDCGGTETLWEFLLSDYIPMPPVEEFYWEAIELLRDRVTSQPVAVEVPF